MSGIEVKVKRGTNIDRSLRRLKRLMIKEGIFQTIKDKKYYKKPSEIRQEKLKHRPKKRK